MEQSPTARFFNRELSWIEFNARVLHEATRKDVPLLERLRFICIVTNNFDEFFMVRVASVKRQIANGDYTQCPSRIKPSELLKRILARTGDIDSAKYRVLVDEILPGLAAHGLALKRPGDFTSTQSSYVKNLFLGDIFPVLTPIRAAVGGDVPYLANLRLHAAFILEPQEGSQWLPDKETQPPTEC
ncbi:MAG: polyphosphate kinase 1, partial [Spirochaetales bacterium]